MKNFQHINIGALLKQRAQELNISEQRICNFLKCKEQEIVKMYQSEHMETGLLLRWSKLLEYDFFRIYSQHLILFAPPSNRQKSNNKSTMPQFKKSIYTIEIIQFCMELINTGQKTKQQIIEEYNIPKTTLYRWINKYDK